MGKTTLVIMAAGMGSRYGGMKQLDPVGPNGEIILDYSVYDAIAAGFQKVVFIIRKDIEEDFKRAVGDKFSGKIEVRYVIQDIDDLPEGYLRPEGRTKPWGTGHAILSCLGAVAEPFAVINADDYYGKESFQKVHAFLQDAPAGERPYHFCMAGFRLGNTLSDNGTVTRGICEVDDRGILVHIEEVPEIAKGRTEAITPRGPLSFDHLVSMNMWGFTPDLLMELSRRFGPFLDGIGGREETAEYLLPEVVNQLIQEGLAQVTVLSTGDQWFGVTYREDRESVVRSFRELVEEGAYPEELFDR